MKDIGRRWIGLPMMMPLALILVLLCDSRVNAASAIVGPWRVCDGPPWAASVTCVPTPLTDVDPQGRMVWLDAEVRLDRRTREPVAVFVSAYASAALYLNGSLVGFNGVPSQWAGQERPGMRDAAFPLPVAASGRHRLTLRMSSHHGIARLRSPVTQVSIAPFESPSSRVIRDYLPALISAGALVMMVLIFAFFALGEEQRTGGRALLVAALFATGQLSAEASRAFLQYPYPMHFLRIALVLVFALGFGFMLLVYLARRFEMKRLWPILLAQTLSASAAILLVANYDQKTGLALASSFAIGMLLAIRAAAKNRPGALPLAAFLALGLVLSLAAPYSFLGRDLYLWTVGLFVLLFIGEARRMNARLTEAEAARTYPQKATVPVGLSLGTAAGRRFILPGDIVRVAAADDYSEVFLVDGGSVLHPEPLQKLLERLPAQFLRVHRSHAINLAHLRSFRKGHGSSVLLSDQSVAPVSRRRVATLLAALES